MSPNVAKLRLFRISRVLLYIALASVVPIFASGSAKQCQDLFQQGYALEVSVGAEFARNKRDENELVSEVSEAGQKIVERYAPEAVQTYRDQERHLKSILSLAFENAYQHGSLDLHRYALGEIATLPPNARSWAKVEIRWDDGFLIFSVVNNQIKPLPLSLQREFKKGALDELSPNFTPLMSNEDRLGFRKHGMAHLYQLMYVDLLPPGSSISWKADGRFVSFILKVNLRSGGQ